MRLVTLKRRSEFLRVRVGNRVGRPAFVLEARPSEGAGDMALAAEETRFGFTVTKALGTAVVRNRIRRRLKAAVQQVIAAGPPLPAAFDVVVVARVETDTIAFAALVAELEGALKRLATAPPGKARGAPRRGGRSKPASGPAHPLETRSKQK